MADHRIVLPWPYVGLWANHRVHHFAKAAAVRKYRTDCGWLLRAANVRAGEVPAQIVIVFCPKSRGPIPDRDNRIGAFKAGQDALADVLRINDRDFPDPIYELGDRCKDGAVILELRGVVS